MPTLSAILILAAPLVVFTLVSIGIRATPIRSPSAASFEQRGVPIWVQAGVAVTAIFLYIISRHSRADSFALGITLTAIAGAAVVGTKLLSTFAYISRFYLDPGHWLTLDSKGARWRYEMQHVFAVDPEYVDGIALELMRQHSTLAKFDAAIRDEGFPLEASSYLDRKYWGGLFPTVRHVVTHIVPENVIRNSGPHSSGKLPEKVYDELRVLASGDQLTFMDRWQYYWCLRNLNLIDRIRQALFSPILFFSTVILGGCLYAVGLLGQSGPALQAACLNALAAGSLLWLLVISGSAALSLIAAFRGTGTFSISEPCYDEDFDPMWSRVIQLGIVAFAVSFVIYGIGVPFFLDPRALENFHLETRFVVCAVGGFVLCALLFAGNVLGVHELMKDSKVNALDRVAAAIAETEDVQERERLAERFRDVRRLRVWPLRGSTFVQLGAGIGLPIVVQAVLLYTGLRAK